MIYNYTNIFDTNPFRKMLCMFCLGMSHWGLFLWAEETSCGEEETLDIGQGQKDKTRSIASSEKEVIYHFGFQTQTTKSAEPLDIVIRFIVMTVMNFKSSNINYLQGTSHYITISAYIYTTGDIVDVLVPALS